MIQRKKIGIIVPAYNVGHLLHETFDSILGQTYTAWECFCVDDGSSDNTFDVMKRYAAKDQRFHIYQQTNKGVTQASNFSLEKIDDTFDYIYFLDSDDYIHPQTFEIMVQIQQSTGVDMVESHMMRVKDEKPYAYFQKLKAWNLPIQIITDMNIYLLKRTRQKYTNTWINKQKLYVWENIKHVRFNEKLSYEDDYMYNSQIHTLTHSKAIIAYPLYYYRINPTSLTHSIDYQMYQKACAARIYATYDYFIKGNRIPPEIIKEFKTDIANDAYRMIGLKPVRRCQNNKLCFALYQNACRIFQDMHQKGILNLSGLSWYKQFVFWSFYQQWYLLTRLLLLFK